MRMLIEKEQNCSLSLLTITFFKVYFTSLKGRVRGKDKDLMSAGSLCGGP